MNTTYPSNDNKQDNSSSSNEDRSQEPLPLHNPLDEGDNRKITQEEIDNEQKFKEALTERD